MRKFVSNLCHGIKVGWAERLERDIATGRFISSRDRKQPAPPPTEPPVEPREIRDGVHSFKPSEAIYHRMQFGIFPDRVRQTSSLVYDDFDYLNTRRR